MNNTHIKFLPNYRRVKVTDADHGLGGERPPLHCSHRPYTVGPVVPEENFTLPRGPAKYCTIIVLTSLHYHDMTCIVACVRFTLVLKCTVYCAVTYSTDNSTVQYR